MLTISNARIFDGTTLRPGKHTVTIDGGRIRSIAEGPASGDGRVLDAGGATLMPGLVTCHMHADFFRYSMADSSAGVLFGKERPAGVMMAIAVRTCGVLLESGFTGYVGASCSNDIDAQLKLAIADGIMPGPRIKACGHHIGTTADLNQNRKWWQTQTTPGTDLFGDGPIELRKIVRDEVRRGAEIIKVFASTGHGFTGRTVRNMERDELQAIVQAAHGRGALVRAHVADKAMMLECIELGVDILDHGDEIDEEVVDAMAAAGTYWVPSLTQFQWWIDHKTPDPHGIIHRTNDGVRRMLPVAHKAGIRILLGDDYSGFFRDICDDDPLDHQVGTYGRELALYGGVEGVSPSDVLSWATRNAGELLGGESDKLGVVEVGAVADLIIVEGDPIADIGLFARPNQSLKAVLRDGEVLIDRLGAGQQNGEHTPSSEPQPLRAMV